MRLETILNRCCKFKSFTFKKVKFSDNGKSIVVIIKSRKNSHPICSKCKKESQGYDKLPSRKFEFIPFWGFSVFFQYAMRRVQCPKCNKIVVERIPWADGKNHLTNI